MLSHAVRYEVNKGLCRTRTRIFLLASFNFHCYNLPYYGLFGNSPVEDSHRPGLLASLVGLFDGRPGCLVSGPTLSVYCTLQVDWVYQTRETWQLLLPQWVHRQSVALKLKGT